MKKIFLSLVLAAMTFFAADAQQTKSKSKKKTVSTESKTKAKWAKIDKEKQQKFEDERIERLQDDSTSREQERMEEYTKDSTRIAWKEVKMRTADSLHNDKWKNQSIEKEKWYATDRSQNVINKNARLTDNQGRQVKNINMVYNDRAKMVRENVTLTDEQKKEQLVTLNEERRAKIQTVIGKSKDRKLEKERKEFTAKSQDDMEAKWINDVADVKKAKKNK